MLEFHNIGQSTPVHQGSPGANQPRPRLTYRVGEALAGEVRSVSRALHAADEVDEGALVVVVEVGQVVGEVGEVVAGAHLEVLAEVVVDGAQRAGLPLTDVR